MPYIKRTTRIGETVEVEYYYTAKKHKADGNKENQENKAKAAANATA